MDAREKWLKQAMQLASIFLFEGRRNDDATPMLKQAGDNLQDHLRTTPEGYMLVPDKPTCWMYTGKVTGTKSFSTVQHDKDSSPPEYFDETPLYAAPPPKSEPL